MHWRRQWQPTPVLLPGDSHGWRSLVGCSPWGREESNTTERLHFHFSLSYTGEGNGTPLQCSLLENPRDGGAWWAAIYGVAQSWTRLKRLSSSSSSSSRGTRPVCLRNIWIFQELFQDTLQISNFWIRALHPDSRKRAPSIDFASDYGDCTTEIWSHIQPVPVL